MVSITVEEDVADFTVIPNLKMNAEIAEAAPVDLEEGIREAELIDLFMMVTIKRSFLLNVRQGDNILFPVHGRIRTIACIIT